MTKTKQQQQQQLVTWDLSELFLGVDDPKINQTIAEAVDIAAEFERAYRGKIAELTPKGVFECLQKIEAFSQKISNVGLYSNLLFAANMTIPEVQALYDKVDKLAARLGIQLAFYHLDLGLLLKNKPHFINDPALANYRYLLERVYRGVEHHLSEVEEQLIIEKDQFGVNAWEELQSKWLNTRVFDIDVLGKKKSFSYGEAAGLLHHYDRATRKAANQAIYHVLGQSGEVFAAALRNICNDWVSISKRRKYLTPMNDSLLANDTEREIIDNLLVSVEAGAKSYRSYLRLKAKLMNLPVLANYDLTAPLPGASELTFTFKQAQDLIIRAYARFDSDYAEAAREMFEKRHIDAAPRFGKRNGAFCASHYNGRSAYILQSFNGTLSDVFTLAHELGHATHDWYMTRNQTPLNTNVPSIVAETASIFGELLLSDLLLAEAKTDTEKQAVLCLILDEAGLTTFQVTARVWFEQALYTAIEQDIVLDYPTICKYWVTARNRIFGNAVQWLPEMNAEWTMKPHYYIANYRFYNYPYVYAQMFVYTLYQQYLTDRKHFPQKLKKALSTGSSASPIAIAQTLQLNPKTPNFWNNGLKTFENLTKTLKKTIDLQKL
jgi:oligoendopeptidase F